MSQFQKIQRSMSDSSSQRRDGSSRRSHRTVDRDGGPLSINPSGLAPSQPSSFAPFLEPNALAAQTLLMPHTTDLFRLDPTLAALSQTTLNSATSAGLLNQTFTNPLQNQSMQQAAQLFAAQNSALNSLNTQGIAGLNPNSLNPLGTNVAPNAWGALQLGPRTVPGESDYLNPSRGGDVRMTSQQGVHRSTLRSPTDSTRMDCSEKKQSSSRSVQRQNSTRQLAPVFPKHQSEISNPQQPSSRIQKPRRSPRMHSNTPSPAVSVITISSESGEDNTRGGNQTGNQAGNGNQQSSSRGQSNRGQIRSSQAVNEFESPPPIRNNQNQPTLRNSPTFNNLPINENHVTSTSANQRASARGGDHLEVKIYSVGHARYKTFFSETNMVIRLCLLSKLNLVMKFSKVPRFIVIRIFPDRPMIFSILNQIMIIKIELINVS